MVTNVKDGSLNTCFGVMGGFMQPQGHVQVLLNMLVFNMTPQEALDAPRICVEAAQEVPDWDGREASTAGVDEVFIEEGIDESVFEKLKEMGHNVVRLAGHGRQKFGRGQVIRRTVEDGVGVWSAGSDPRADGHASPL